MCVFRFLVQLKLLVNRKYIFPMIDEKLHKNGKYVLQGKRKLCFFPPLSSLPPHCEVWTIATCHHHSPHDVVGSIAYQPLHHQSSNTNRHSIYPLPSHHHPHAYCRQLAIYVSNYHDHQGLAAIIATTLLVVIVIVITSLSQIQPPVFSYIHYRRWEISMQQNTRKLFYNLQPNIKKKKKSFSLMIFSTKNILGKKLNILLENKVNIETQH